MTFSATSANFFRILQDHDKILYFEKLSEEGEDVAYLHFAQQYVKDVVDMFTPFDEQVIVNFYRITGIKSGLYSGLDVSYIEVDDAFCTTYFVASNSLKDINAFVLKNYEMGSLLVKDEEKQLIVQKRKKHAKVLNLRYLRCFTRLNEGELFLCYN